jgi:hypothetical protein
VRFFVMKGVNRMREIRLDKKNQLDFQLLRMSIELDRSD